ncbi:hypothetical protein [Haloechinothrix halophila]|uniref:hypothetical protein n=1 Tax=Haloechinothrix halophila TaxID=1069073 RepID=UPI00041ED447|nr:hypothetical protein [Haloechinothrix halophila]
MSTIHEQPAAHTDSAIAPAPRPPGRDEFRTDQSDVPFGIPTPRDDEDFEPTIIRGRE